MNTKNSATIWFFFMTCNMMTNQVHAQLPTQSPACPTPDQNVVLNIAFDYKKVPSIKLVGTDNDRRVMAKVSEKLGSKVVTVSDNSSMVLSKKNFLAFLGTQTAGKNVVFNYTGHGVPTSDGNFAFVLPNIPSACIVKDTNKNAGKKSGQGLYRGFHIFDPKKDKSNAKAGAVAKQQNCWDFVVTAAELKTATHNKIIGGFVDSCYSGALKNSSGVNVIYSSSQQETSQDGYKGGLLFQYVDKVMSKYGCTVDGDGDGQINFNELGSALPSLFLTNQGSLLNFSSIDNLKVDYFRQAPGHANANAAKDACLNVCSYSKDQCASPVPGSFVVGQKDIKCGDAKAIPAGQEVAVVGYTSKGGALISSQYCPAVIEIPKSDLLRKILKSGEGNQYPQSIAPVPGTR